MKTGILRDDVTVKEWKGMSIASEIYVDDIGLRLDIDKAVYPESWYTDIREDHKPCPRCGCPDAGLSISHEGYYVYCYKCSINTRYHDEREQAWADWDKDYD